MPAPAANEWLEVTCTCGKKVLFPYLGYKHVRCPTCSTVLSTEAAVQADVPDAQTQAQAVVDAMPVGPTTPAESAKEFAKKFQWLETLCDRLEALILGAPTKQGNVKMYLGRRLYLPPSSVFYLIPSVLILTPFCILAYYYPFTVANSWLPYLVFLAHAFLLLAHITEPGIVGRHPPCLPKPDISMEVRGQTVPVKWCTTCHRYRPPRGAHCAKCDVCVSQFDHHCHVTGTCVGGRNLRYFTLFLLTTTAACCLALYLAVTFFFHSSDAKRAASFIVVVWTAFGCLALFSMTSTTLYITSKGLTTREFSKRLFPSRGHPFDHGSYARNAVSLLLRQPVQYKDCEQTV